MFFEILTRIFHMALSAARLYNKRNAERRGILMETVLSGYCRTIDGSRMVLIEDGEADCDFDTCAYRDVCQIGQQIARLQEETEGTL